MSEVAFMGAVGSPFTEMFPLFAEISATFRAFSCMLDIETLQQLS
jgi:hypothetical protein